MIKIEFGNIEEIKEFVEVFRVVETSNDDIVCFGEVESLDSCTEENAKNALDIIKKHKQSDRKEKAYKTYLGLEKAEIEEIYKIHYVDKEKSELDEKYCNHDDVSKDKDTNESECTCAIDLSSIDSSTVYYSHHDVSKGEDISDLECTCFICSKKIENKEDIFKMPFLTRDYLSSTKEIKDIEICEKCLDGNSWSVIRRKQLKKMKNKY